MRYRIDRADIWGRERENIWNTYKADICDIDNIRG